MSDESDQETTGPPGDPESGQAPSPSSLPPTDGGAPAAVPPGPSRRERLRRAGARRSVQLVVAGILGAIIGGSVVGALGAVTDGDRQPKVGVAEYGRHGPFMRGPRGWHRGGPGWYPPAPWMGKVPGQGGSPATPVPLQPAPASPAPSPSAPVKTT
jgi:hypothetical protein